RVSEHERNIHRLASGAGAGNQRAAGGRAAGVCPVAGSDSLRIVVVVTTVIHTLIALDRVRAGEACDGWSHRSMRGQEISSAEIIISFNMVRNWLKISAGGGSWAGVLVGCANISSLHLGASCRKPCPTRIARIRETSRDTHNM